MDAGFDVTMVGTGASAVFADHKIPYVQYELDRFFDLYGNWRSFRHLARLVRERRPDIVHGFDTKPSLLAPLAVRHGGRGRAVRTINGMGSLFSAETPATKILRPVYRNMQRHVRPGTAFTVFQNQRDLAYFLSNGMVDRDRSCVIPGSGIDLETFDRQRPDPEDADRLRETLGLEGKTVITTVTRLTRQKGIPVLLEVASDLASRYEDLAFLLVGPRETEGPFAVERSEIDRHAGYVHMLGRRDDVPAILSISDLFFFPTEYREGLPRVLLEAGAAGLAMVASDVPGCDEVVRDDHNGFLVPPGDVRGFVHAIEDLMDDHEKRKRMGALGREAVSGHLSLDRVVEAYANIYRSILSGTDVVRN